MPMVQGANGFSVIDTGNVPAVQDIALMDANESFGQLLLKGFQCLEGSYDISVPHMEIGTVVVRFKIKDFPGVQIPIIIIGFKAQGRGQILLWMFFSQTKDGLSDIKFIMW